MLNVSKTSNLNNQRLLYLNCSRWEKSLGTMASKWSQMKFAIYFSRRIDRQSSSILGSILNQPERHIIPTFRRIVPQIAMRRLEWFNPTQHMTHADEKRWDASDMDGSHTHMAYGARRRDETQWHHQTPPPEWVTELSHATRTPNLE